jgi:hypothetical protein
MDSDIQTELMRVYRKVGCSTTMRNAPHQIGVVDLERGEVAETLKCRKAPYRDPRQTALPMITNA